MVAFVNEDEMYLYAMPSGAAGRPDEMRRWAEVRTGWTIDASGTVAQLGPAEWERLRQNASAETAGGDDGAFDNLADRNMAQGIIHSGNGEYYAVLWNINKVVAAGTSDPGSCCTVRKPTRGSAGRRRSRRPQARDRAPIPRQSTIGLIIAWLWTARHAGTPYRLPNRPSIKPKTKAPCTCSNRCHPPAERGFGVSAGVGGGAVTMHFFNQTKRRVRVSHWIDPVPTGCFSTSHRNPQHTYGMTAPSNWHAYPGSRRGDRRRNLDLAARTGRLTGGILGETVRVPAPGDPI